MRVQRVGAAQDPIAVARGAVRLRGGRGVRGGAMSIHGALMRQRLVRRVVWVPSFAGLTYAQRLENRYSQWVPSSYKWKSMNLETVVADMPTTIAFSISAISKV